MIRDCDLLAQRRALPPGQGRAAGVVVVGHKRWGQSSHGNNSLDSAGIPGSSSLSANLCKVCLTLDTSLYQR